MEVHGLLKPRFLFTPSIFLSVYYFRCFLQEGLRSVVHIVPPRKQSSCSIIIIMVSCLPKFLRKKLVKSVKKPHSSILTSPHVVVDAAACTHSSRTKVRSLSVLCAPSDISVHISHLTCCSLVAWIAKLTHGKGRTAATWTTSRATGRAVVATRTCA